MAEYIKCRNCESPDCKGCNLKRLETMLENGKFDCMMNENRCINTSADVEPVQEWIPVTERLPEESGMYIITANDGHAQRVSFVQWQKKNRMWNLTGARSYWRVTHWQPLPQPPKGE